MIIKNKSFYKSYIGKYFLKNIHFLLFFIKIYCIVFVIYLIIIDLYSNKKYHYCFNCKDNFNKTSECFKCPLEVVFRGLKIASDEKTLNEIIINKKSISRFGDGEYRLMYGGRILYQKYNNYLSQKLIEIFKNNQKGFLVGIHLPYKDFKKITKREVRYWTRYLNRNKFKLLKLLNIRKKYYSSTISRFYMRNKDKSNTPKYVKKLKKIWEKKDILIIEGEKSRIGVGNNLFDNVKSIKRIICPKKNAFKVYDKIIREVLKIKEKRLILIALGPTATVLAYDLYKLGYQAIDIGHADIEYEWFLRNSTRKISIENKIVNEVCGNRCKFTDIKDKNYTNQIFSKIVK